MWICLNNAFLSVVEDRETSNELLIRARRQVDINVVAGLLENGEYRIEHTPKNDYQFRIRADKSEFKLLMNIMIDNIDYGNFKNSVDDDALKTMYGRVWGLGVENLDPEMPYRTWKMI